MRPKKIALLGVLAAGVLALGSRGANAQTAFRDQRGSGFHGRTSMGHGNGFSSRSGQFARHDGNRGFRGDRFFRSTRYPRYRGFYPGYRSYYPSYAPVYDPYDLDPYYTSYGPVYDPYPRYRVRRYVAPFPIPRVVIPLPLLPGLHWGHRH